VELHLKSQRLYWGIWRRFFSVAAYVLLCVCCYLFWDGSCVGYLVWKHCGVGRRGVFMAGVVFKIVS